MVMHRNDQMENMTTEYHLVISASPCYEPMYAWQGYNGPNTVKLLCVVCQGRLVMHRTLGQTLAEKRSYLADRLTKIGFKVLPAQGSYFLVADIRYAEPTKLQTRSC